MGRRKNRNTLTGIIQNLILLIMLVGSLAILAQSNQSRVVENTLEVKAVKAIIDVYKVSSGVKRQYVHSIIRWSKEYNVPPITIAAIIGRECGFNPYFKHDEMYVETDKGKRLVRPLGAGVIYEKWYEELETIGITLRHSLKNIDINTRALCFILNITKEYDLYLEEMSIKRHTHPHTHTHLSYSYNK